MSNASDFVNTAEEKHQAGQSLLMTEQTDAINSGIVGGNNVRSPKGYSPSAGNPKIRQLASGKTAHAENMREAFHEETLSTQGQFFPKQTLGTLGKQGGRAGIQKGIHQTLEDTELEGTDDLYYNGKRTYKTARKIGTLFGSRKTAQAHPASDTFKSRGVVKNHEPSLANVKSKKATGKAAAHANSKTQFASYFKKNVYQAAATKTQATATSKFVVAPIGKAMLGKLAAVGVVPLLMIIVGLLSIVLLSAIFTGADEERSKQETSFGSLTGIQLEVAQVLADYGLNHTQIAAIMGNISGESGWNPTAEYHGQGNNTSYEYGYGLFQFTDTNPGVGNYTNFKKWCAANGKDINSATAQTEFFMTRLASSWNTGLHSSGYYAVAVGQYANANVSYSNFLQTDDLGLATYAFLACYERPAAWAVTHSYPTRFAEAQKFYAQLTSSGEEFNASTATQQELVAAANRTPSPGINLCAMWVSSVYSNAGLGYIGGNANDMYRSFAHNSDRSQLKVGMVVAVESSSSGGRAGATWGHVGIYIGDGKVMHNVGSIQTMSLDDWIAAFCKHHPVGWGFPPNVSIEK